MKLKNWLGAAVIGGAMTMAAPSANAVVVLDQLSQVARPVNWDGTVNAGVGYINPAVFGSYQLAGTFVSSAQSITANARGKLDHIDFSLRFNFNSYYPGPGNLVLSLIDGDYDSGARTVIGKSAVNTDNLPAFNDDANLLNLTFQTSSFNYHVKAGQIFSILFDADPNTTTGLAGIHAGYAYYDPGTGVGGNVYPNYIGGRLTSYYSGTDLPNLQDPSLDLTFASYVDTAAGVPEPAAWALMIVGFGGIGLALRRRQVRVGRLTGVGNFFF